MTDSFADDERDPQAFLDRAYTRLALDEGALLEAVHFPTAESREEETWVDRGDWLSLAATAGVDRVFFVDNDPVLVFCALNSGEEEDIREFYRTVWCMARPKRLFLALEGELRVYDLSQPPARDEAEWAAVSPLVTVESLSAVGEELKNYRRAAVESGQAFTIQQDLPLYGRADQRLIQDLKTARQKLLQMELEPKYAHALLGRAIFIRYLEDREILTEEYFRAVASGHPAWEEALDEPLEKADLNESSSRWFDRVLRSKPFTFALFGQLATDFNGDMFPRDDEEERNTTPEHLQELRRFLLGEPDAAQPGLFFWAYDFRIIPTELISSIYEEFYHSDEVPSLARGGTNRDQAGTHYTPAFLVEDVLSRLLPAERLDTRPRVIDPACGSGIFLVETFRRMIRHHARFVGRMPTRLEIRTILQTQIAGIEINPEATRIAAFSLYLALLHYQDPRDIRRNPKLPRLIGDATNASDNDSYSILFNADAFDLTREEDLAFRNRLEESRRFEGRADVSHILTTAGRLPVTLGTFDVVVGNPPWREAKKTALPVLWARANLLPVGDQGLSQLFLLRALALVKEGGIVGLLVHANVLFNQRETSRVFRAHLLAHTRVLEVVNFSHVRRFIFERAIAPFVYLSVARNNGKLSARDRFVYTSARLTDVVEQTPSILLSSADRRIVSQSDVQTTDYLWKTYWWGGHRDAALLARLDIEEQFRNLLPEEHKPGYGFQRGTRTPSETLRRLRPLRSRGLHSFGSLQENWFESTPMGTKREPDENLYVGQRIIAVRGVPGSGQPCIRLEYKPFSFRHTIYCVPLPHIPKWKAKVILGIFWSALGKYRLFLTSGSWGTWYHSLVPNDLLSLPVRFTNEEDAITKRILRAVDRLRNLKGDPNRGESRKLARTIQRQLDEAVFDLFDLLPPERDLVRDFLRFQFDLFKHGARSNSVAPVRRPTRSWGTSSTLHGENGMAEKYIRSLLELWNPQLGPDGEFTWQWIQPDASVMIAAVFTTRDRREELVIPRTEEEERLWERALERASEALRQPVSERVYIDGIARAVSDTQILILKRNERRLWSSSAAREDAEATLLQALRMQEAVSAAGLR
ncbi:MAG TPA: N-6 DNA methylase [Longimicrobium sp.]|jgi:hypothetical protein